MENNIAVGVIIGLVTASSLYVWNSKSFTKVQKTFLLILLVFPPLQWVSILLVLAYNKFQIENSLESESLRKVSQTKNKLELAKESLQDLKESGIIDTREYNEKVEKIEDQIYKNNLLNTNEYKQLKYLFDSDILTKEEFDGKIELLKSKKSDENIIVNNRDYRIVDGYSEGFALVIDDNLDYGYINADGKVVIDFLFEHAENFHNGRAKIRINGEFKKIDYGGNII